METPPNDGTSSIPDRLLGVFQNGPERYLTVKEIGYMLNRTSGAVSHWFRNYPGVIDIGEGYKHRLRIPVEVLAQFLRERCS